jgi:hypothetical protein
VKTLFVMLVTLSMCAASSRQDTTYVTVVNSILKVAAQDSGAIDFEISGSPRGWAYWVGVSAAYNYLVDILKVSKTLASFAENPLQGLLAGDITELETGGSNLDIGYSLRAWDGTKYAYMPGHGASRTTAVSRVVSNRYGNGFYYVKLNNTYSLWTAKQVKVQVTAMYVSEPTSEPSEDKERPNAPRSVYTVWIVANYPIYPGLHELMEELRELGYTNSANAIEISSDDLGDARVEWGAAPQEYVNQVVQKMKAHTEMVWDSVKLRHTLDADDTKIRIVIPGHG